MTKRSFGGQEVDTSQFRTAVENYLMQIYGVKDDTVDYRQINKVLQIQHKIYIKRMMCDPNHVCYDDFKDLTILTAEERAHISLLVMTTKKRVELLYLTKMMSLFF